MRKTRPRPFWLIARHRAGGMEVLTTALAAGEEALPVFGFEDEAQAFLELGMSDGGWRPWETTLGELTSVLFGPCAGVDRVVLDPAPGPFAEALMDLASMGRKAFVETYLKSGEPRRSAAGAGHRCRQRDDAPARRTMFEGGNRDVE